jgi:hypothetical protein
LTTRETRACGFTRNTGILPVFAWAGSARRRGGRHPGGQSGAIWAPLEAAASRETRSSCPFSLGRAPPAIHGGRHPGGQSGAIWAPQESCGFTRNTSILLVFAWAGSARSSKRRHPGGRSGARDTATQRRRDAHRPALKARGRPCSESRRSRQAQPGGRSAGGSERVEAMDGRSERPAGGTGDPEASRLSQAPDVTRAAMPLSKEPKEPKG